MSLGESTKYTSRPEPAKSFFSFKALPTKTFADEFNKVEMHFNQGLQLSDWLDIRVDEPALQENG